MLKQTCKKDERYAKRFLFFFFFSKGVCHKNLNLKAPLWNFEPWFVPTYHDHLLLLEVGTKKGIKGIK